MLHRTWENLCLSVHFVGLLTYDDDSMSLPSRRANRHEFEHARHYSPGSRMSTYENCKPSRTCLPAHWLVLARRSGSSAISSKNPMKIANRRENNDRRTFCQSSRVNEAETGANWVSLKATSNHAAFLSSAEATTQHHTSRVRHLQFISISKCRRNYLSTKD